MGSPAELTRRVTFSAAHRYRLPQWDDLKNLAVFGKCAHEHYHGHRYIVDVTARGEIDPLTGFVVDLGALDNALRVEVYDRFDHKNINLDVSEFAEGKLVPSSENLARFIFERLRARVPAVAEVRVIEDDTLWATYRGGD